MIASCVTAALLVSAQLGSSRMLMGSNSEILNLGTAKESYCQTPIAKAKVEFPESLAGRANINYDMYSGYINVTSEDWLFYWFFGTADGNENAPLVIWTNGGPGCTSMVNTLTATL